MGKSDRSTTDSHEKIGIIDLGSNTVLLLVLDHSGLVVADELRITRLAERVFESGRLSPGARERTRRAVSELAETAREAGAERLIGVGTAALRHARDGAAFLSSLQRPGLLDEGRVLSGAEEARFTIEAALRGERAAGRPLVVIDVGGGSTEVARLVSRAVSGAGSTSKEGEVEAVSLPLGSVRLTERFLPQHPVPSEHVAALRAWIREQTASLRPEPGARVVAVAGTATTLAALKLQLARYDRDRVEGFELSSGDLSGWIERLAALDVAARSELPGLEPGRADVIVAGLLILEQVLERLEVGSFRASGRGVRYGVALSLLGGRNLAPQ
jgi:exopolyphosphatase/guanosine-5'-triphosphate,3'-diphosphate pyrophosphatase